MDTSTLELDALRSSYCPPLDEALFYAIASEYELPKDRDTLSSVLENLKAGALEQEEADFDPSGTGGRSILHDTTGVSRSSPDDSLFNGVTTITTGLSELLIADTDSLGSNLEHASTEEKTLWLLNVFPDIPKKDLAEVLESHGGSLDKATDELLNLSFLNQGREAHISEEESRPKGIEAFAEENLVPRKGRKKRRNQRTESSRASSTASYSQANDLTTFNVWSTMSEDVNFICSRTMLQPQVVRSAYHLNGARRSSTIRALAVKEGAAATVQNLEDSSALDIQIMEIQGDFEHVPRDQMIGLLRIARNIPSAARELLEAMMTPDHRSDSQNLTLATQYVPINIDESDSDFYSSSSTSTWNSVRPRNRESAAVHRAAASHSFGQASAAFKRGKSDRLMGGAAAYYSQVGHERMKAAKEIQAAEADLLVRGQSSANVLDLHGVSVADALRITRERTQAWWHDLGDAKYASGGGGPARAGFKIVTGIGSHSKNHAPRIGPAVSKMLLQEGWKVEIGHGELVVTGKARKKAT